MKKTIQATFRDGSIWSIPAQPIAENRAKHYAETVHPTTYEQELAYTLSDDYELKNWAIGNMHTSELAKHATCVQPAVPLPFEEGWNDSENTTHEVKELP